VEGGLEEGGAGFSRALLGEARVLEHSIFENRGDSLEPSTEASAQGNCDAGCLGGYTGHGQGALLHPGLSYVPREPDAASGVQGRSPAQHILDYNATTGRKLKNDDKPFWWNLTEEAKRERKFKRAYQRFMLGVGMPGEYRLLTLTTPENFRGDIHEAWRKFLKRMGRRGMIREYFAVKEWNKAHTCQHLHIVLRLDYIGYQVALQQWKAVTGAVWIHVDKVCSVKGMACYLGKYLNKAYDEEPGKRSYWYAYEWIYRKWRAFSKAMFKLGESVAVTEHGLIHGIKESQSRLKHMNGRLVEATLRAVRAGIPVKELVQF